MYNYITQVLNARLFTVTLFGSVDTTNWGLSVSVLLDTAYPDLSVTARIGPFYGSIAFTR